MGWIGLSMQVAGKAAEGMWWPVDVSMRPVRRLGNAAFGVVSSGEIALQRIEEDMQAREQRDIATAIALACYLRGHLQSRYEFLPDDRREAMQQQLDDTAQRIGYMVLDARCRYEELFSQVGGRAVPTLGTEE